MNFVCIRIAQKDKIELTHTHTYTHIHTLCVCTYVCVCVYMYVCMCVFVRYAVYIAREKNNADGKEDMFTLKNHGYTLYHCEIMVIRYGL